MARTLIPAQILKRTGILRSFTTVSSTDNAEFYNNGNMFLVISQGNGTEDLVATVKPQATIEGHVGNVGRQITVPHIATGVNPIYWGPWPTQLYNTNTGKVQLDLATKADTSASSWSITLVEVNQ